MTATSPLLLDGEFIAYYPALAKRLGGQPMRAIIVQALWFRRDRSTDETRMSYEALGDMVGCSGDTAKRQVKWLVDNGYVHRGRASSHDATSVFRILHDALTSTNTPTPSANPSVGSGESASSTRRIRTIDQGNLPSSAPEPIAGVQNRTVEEGNLPSSHQGNLPSSTTSKNSKNTSSRSDGFREFWAAYPDTGYKGRKDDCRRIWLDMPLEERRAAYKMLQAYKTSVLWTDTERISTPYQWLNNEPWLGDAPRQVVHRTFLSPEDVALD